jgi:hypothetical protein
MINVTGGRGSEPLPVRARTSARHATSARRTRRARRSVSTVLAGLALSITSSAAAHAHAGATAQQPAPAASSPLSDSSASVVQRMVLTVDTATGATRTYTARVLDADGRALSGANPDIGAMSDNPDYRVATRDMVPSPSDPTRYVATLTYPATGPWVLVVRVNEPTEYVHLGSETIDDAALPATSGHADSPSRAALRAINPDFKALYNPYTGIGATGQVPTEAELAAARATDSHGAGTAVVTDHGPSAGFTNHTDGLVTTIVVAVVHLGGAAAWLLGMLGLTVASWLRPSSASSALVGFVRDRYRLLAGGGLLALVVTGLMNIERATPTGFDVGALLDSTLGRWYFAVFGCKMALVASSIVLSGQIGSLLRSSERSIPGLQLRSASAAARIDPLLDRALRLGQLNAYLGGAILICVVALDQLHRALH